MKKTKALLGIGMAAAITFSSVVGGFIPSTQVPAKVFAEDVDDNNDDWDEDAHKNTGLEEYDPIEIKDVEGLDTFCKWLGNYYFSALSDLLTTKEEELDPDSKAVIENIRNKIPEFMAEGTVRSDEVLGDYLDSMSDDEQTLYEWLVDMSLIFVGEPDLVRYDSFKEYLSKVEEVELSEKDRATIDKVFEKLNQDIGENAMIPIPVAEKTLGFSGNGFSKDAMTDNFWTFFLANPQFYFYRFSNGYVEDDSGKIRLIVPRLLDVFNTSQGIENPKEQAGVELATDRAMQRKIDQALSEIKEMIKEDKNKNYGEWEKARCVHDWLVAHVDYDHASQGYVKESYIENSRYADYWETIVSKNDDGTHKKNQKAGGCYIDENYCFSQSIFSSFGRRVIDDTHIPIFFSDEKTERPMEKRYNRDNPKVEYFTVCTGYSQAFCLLARLMGLDAVSILSPSHTWNMVKANGEWRQVDVTWDDLGGETNINAIPTSVGYEYFGVAADKGFMEDHDYEAGELKELANFLGKDIVKVMDEKKVPAFHAYSKKDSPNFEKCYMIQQKGTRMTLYGPVTPGKVDEKPVNHSAATSQLVAKDLSDDQFKRAGYRRICDLPFYFAHTDKVGSGGSTSYNSGSSSSSSTSTSTTTTTYKKGGGKDKDKDKSNVHIVGKGASRGGYSKHGKKNNKYVTFEYPDGKYKMKKFIVPDEVKIKKKTFKVKKIAANAFSGYDKLQEVTIGKYVEKIGKNAFDGCKKLTTLTLTSEKYTAKNVKKAFKGAKIKTILVPAAKVEAYKKIFTKANTKNKIQITVRAIEPEKK